MILTFLTSQEYPTTLVKMYVHENLLQHYIKAKVVVRTSGCNLFGQMYMWTFVQMYSKVITVQKSAIYDQDLNHITLSLSVMITTVVFDSKFIHIVD